MGESCLAPSETADVVQLLMWGHDRHVGLTKATYDAG
jgi:hypothetical protein